MKTAITVNDLISRSALAEHLKGLSDAYDRGFEIDKSDGVQAALGCLRMAPAVDAVPVVYCRECKHWRVGLDRTNTWCERMNKVETVECDFCSLGERRADDGGD